MKSIPHDPTRVYFAQCQTCHFIISAVSEAARDAAAQMHTDYAHPQVT